MGEGSRSRPATWMMIALLLGSACASTGSSERPDDAGAPAATAAKPPATDEAAREKSLAAEARGEDRLPDAALHYEKALRVAPDDLEARLGLVQVLLERSVELGRASALLAEAKALAPDDPRVDRLRGWLDELRGDDAAAVADYERVLARDEEPELRAKVGMLLLRQNRLDDAVAAFERVAAERPTDRGVRSTLAEIFEYQGRSDRAETALKEIVALAPNDATALRRLAAFYRRQQQPVKASEVDAAIRALDGPPRSLRPLRRSAR